MGEEFDISGYIYDKQFTCPVCDATFTTTVARHGKSRLVSTDTDLKQNFSPFDPITYDIVVCSSCGYAESVKAFSTPISENTAERILEEIRPKYGGITYPEKLSTDNALEKFEIAAACNEVKRGKLGVRAHIYLKMAWVCRNAGETEREQKCLAKAVDYFKQAFQTEDVPIAGMNENAISYMIGELERRIGNEEDALKWFSKVVASRNAERRIKDRALDQKTFILDKRKAEQAEAEQVAKAAEPEKPPEKPKKKGLFGWFK